MRLSDSPLLHYNRAVAFKAGEEMRQKEMNKGTNKNKRCNEKYPHVTRIMIRTKEDNRVKRSFRKRSISLFHIVSWLVLETIAIKELTQAGSIIKDRRVDQG